MDGGINSRGVGSSRTPLRLWEELRRVWVRYVAGAAKQLVVYREKMVCGDHTATLRRASGGRSVTGTTVWTGEEDPKASHAQHGSCLRTLSPPTRAEQHPFHITVEGDLWLRLERQPTLAWEPPVR